MPGPPRPWPCGLRLPHACIAFCNAAWSTFGGGPPCGALPGSKPSTPFFFKHSAKAEFEPVEDGVAVVLVVAVVPDASEDEPLPPQPAATRARATMTPAAIASVSRNLLGVGVM